MPSRSSSVTDSRSSQSIYTAHFPRAEGRAASSDALPIPLRPRNVGPVFDKTLASQPIAEFDPFVHARSYVAHCSSEVPEQPQDEADPYLMPSLTESERLRLTLFWYYTSSNKMLEDDEFLLRLQEKLDLVQAFMGWEFAIMGLLSEDVYTRVATAGLPLAILPRRESTCSHTINQPPGTVFMLPNMASDWRFKNSPHVKEGGLRSYAGAQLRCKADTGEEIALGSLCIASNTVQPPLTQSQQDALVRFADMIASEIISRAREGRRRQRHVMAELIAQTHQFHNPDDIKKHIFRIIAQVYPEASLSIQDSDQQQETIHLPGHSPVHVGDISDGLWEDTELIEDLIVKHNFSKLASQSTVRAIAHCCQTHPTTKYLVLSSANIQLVFDDVDSWFIERCATIMSNTIVENRLREALTAKDTFLRGITHQLRTPIHGVLGSCELLAEELASRDLLQSSVSGLDPSSVLSTIRDSGRELMSTVNNMLKLNRWAETDGTPQPASLATFNQVEADIMYEVHQSIPEHEMSDISIMFENRLASDDSMIVMDLSLLKECIQALVLNALSYTDRGAVIIVISASADYTRLTFDIKDTGRGIPLEDQERIFEAYEKVDSHTRGAGLGLTLSAKIAVAMNGSVTLVSSEQNSPTRGSLFRAEFRDPGFACPIPRPVPFYAALKDIPRSFHVVPAVSQRPELVLHFASHLSHRGFEDSDKPEGSIIIVTYTSDAEEFRNYLTAIDPRQVAMCLIPAGATMDKLHGAHEVRAFSGPFLTSRLEDITKELDDVYKRLHSNPDYGETATGLANSDDAHRTAGSETHIDPADAQPVALLVDDNIVNLRIMRMYCDKRRIRYSTAVDGAEAVSIFEKSLEDHPINLILMDLQMPICDGVEATRQIREIEDEQSLPRSAIFMVTGQDSVSDKQKSFEAGADEFYVKPMSLKTLDKGIKEYFPGVIEYEKKKKSAPAVVENGETQQEERSQNKA